MRVIRSLQSFQQLPLLFIAVAVLLCSVLVTPHLASAATDDSDGGFSLQVSPSPLVATVKPGVTTTLDLNIRNTASKTQALKMGLRSFTIDGKTGKVQLGTSAPGDVSQFVGFSQPTFTLQSGDLLVQHITIDTPASAGFTYSFAITIAQQNPPKGKNGTSAIAGSVAVFTLLNVDKPGAVRKLDLSQFTSSKHVYEYLPATFTLTFKDSGNTLVQPSGTIFIQRHANDTQPITSIEVNPGDGYILPGSIRSLTATWNDGFPHYQTAGTAKSKLTWSGGDFSKLRFGRYVAKLVAVYNDGNRDVPIEAEVTFWVIPWRMLFGVFLVLILIVVGGIVTIRKSSRLVRRKAVHHDPKPKI